MRLDLSNLNPPVWFDHAEDKEARICLRVASARDLDEIRKTTVKRRKEYRRGQRFEYEEIDEQQQNNMLWQLCILDWEGLYDQDNKPIPCTDENKVLLMNNEPIVSKWVAECLEKLNDDMIERQKSAEKNSLKSQND